MFFEISSETKAEKEEEVCDHLKHGGKRTKPPVT